MRIPEEIKQFADEVPIMAFATANPDGTPNVVAIGRKKIVGDETIWVIDTFFGKTKANILRNNKVAIAMWDAKKLEGYQIKGTATYHSKGKVFEEGKDWVLKLKPNKIVKGVVEIKVTEIYDLTPVYGRAGKRIV